MKSKLNGLYRFACFTGHRLLISRCLEGATVLTYTSLFALVPMMTVAYVLLSFMPTFDAFSQRIEPLIFTNFLPETGYQIKQYLVQFSQQAESLTIPGIVVLIITSLLMLRTIETTFNNIWGVQQGRRGLAGFLLYWAVLSLGPILAGAGLMFSTYLLSLSFLGGMHEAAIMHPLTGLIPLILTTTALCLMYVVAPHCRVPFRDALIGAIIAGLCFELAKKIFAYAVVHSSYTLIYGAFAIVPLFLLWINLCWLIVLCGAVLVHSIGIFNFTTNEGQAVIVDAKS